MDKLVEIFDIQASSDEAMNTLLVLHLEDSSGLKTCLFEEARAFSLTDPNDEDILTLTVSIENLQKIPRTLMRNRKRSIQDLSFWRSSQECLMQVENAYTKARSYSLHSALSPDLSPKITPVTTLH